MSILVIENDEAIVICIKECLEAFKLSADFIEKASDAIKILENKPYDYIIMDHHTCLVENLCCAFNNFPGHFIIMSSFRSAAVDFKELRDKTILEKPFDLNAFEECLKECI